MRKSNVFFTYIILNIVIMCLVFVHAYFKRKAVMPILGRKTEIVKKFELTDLCLFTEARYTRHPSQADLNTPFQDYPMSFEHFPSGSLIVPPEVIKGMKIQAKRLTYWGGENISNR